MPYICLVNSSYDDAVAQGTFVIDDIRPDASQVSGTYANTALGPLRPQVADADAVQAVLEAEAGVAYAAASADAALIVAHMQGGNAMDTASLQGIGGLDLNTGAVTLSDANAIDILAAASGDTGYDRKGGNVVSSGALAASIKNGKLSKLIADGDVVIYNDDGSLY
tara:strand:+ start:2365 stop:2862 length:498 start_codon:yes stop_codon:yes gene_type:complete